MNLNHFVVFRAVAEHGTFTAAAAALGTDKANVSRAVRALEASLGVVLVARSTRRVALTPAGEGLFALVRGPLDVLERAGPTIVDRARTPAGDVGLTTTPDLARVLVAPLIPAFRLRFPLVRVRIRAVPDVDSFSNPEIDLALRVGATGEADVRLRKLAELEAGFFASPRYLAARGTPEAPEELVDHETIWPEAAAKTSFAPSRPAPPPTIGCDDFAVGLEVAVAGGGVALLPVHLARSSVREGGLVRLFPALALRGAPLYLVTRRERPLPARVAALRDHLEAHLAG